MPQIFGATNCVPGNDFNFVEADGELHEFAKEKGNQLSVVIKDIDVTFGPSEGWENYGGIIRDVYIEYTDEYIIDDVFWYTGISDDFSSAKCNIKVSHNAEDAIIS